MTIHEADIKTAVLTVWTMLKLSVITKEGLIFCRLAFSFSLALWLKAGKDLVLFCVIFLCVVCWETC